MSLTPISTERTGRKPHCTYCGAGSTISFNWEYAGAYSKGTPRRDLAVFAEVQALRHGTLHRCTACGQVWYRYGRPEFMHVVSKDRISLIQRWNQKPILLTAAQRSQLAEIGATPPDLYGNGSQYQETPCAVTTAEGERFEMAIVSVQAHAPFEDGRPVRLASEIVEIFPSPHALPLNVRVRSSQAEEIRMGLSPTMVEAPDGAVLMLNGVHHFFVRESCMASEVRLSRASLSMSNPPAFYSGVEKVLYFVADPDAASE
jgi:hypothetical protein